MTSESRRPRVSIGLPVYNGERFLSEALDSLCAQTFRDFELIISDNASNDRTAAICAAYAAQDHRIRYIRNPRNIGVYRNCNQVIRVAAGEYVKLAASDDICAPDLLARCVDVLDRDPSIVATYGRTRFIDSDGDWLNWQDPGWNLMSDSPLERLRYVLVSGHWVNVFFGLVRSKELAATRLFPLYAGGDCRLLGELCLRGKFCEIPDYLFYRRVHPSASSQNSDAAWQSQFFSGRHGRIELPFWHVCVDHVGTIVRSSLSAREKCGAVGLIARRMLTGRRELAGELHRASRQVYRSVSRRECP